MFSGCFRGNIGLKIAKISMVGSNLQLVPFPFKPAWFMGGPSWWII